MKIVWRFQGTAVFLAPLAIRELILLGIPHLTGAQWGTFLMSAASYSVLCASFSMSINYTSVANATILTNSPSILHVLGKLLTGHPVVFLEGFGVFVAFAGAVLSAKDSAKSEETDESAWLSLWGDTLGIISSSGGIGYIVLWKIA
jgi:drug/metabolite transporter (DMT)-like permease